MLIRCPIHGLAGVCFVSPALLDLQPDGSLSPIITVDVKDNPNEEAFFRFNVSPQEIASYAITDNTVPFDLHALDIMDQMRQMCGFCFEERRDALEAQAKRVT
jgi:hypothetical protein